MEFVGPWTVHNILFETEKSTFAVTVHWTVTAFCKTREKKKKKKKKNQTQNANVRKRESKQRLKAQAYQKSLYTHNQQLQSLVWAQVYSYSFIISFELSNYLKIPIIAYVSHFTKKQRWLIFCRSTPTPYLSPSHRLVKGCLFSFHTQSPFGMSYKL